MNFPGFSNAEMEPCQKFAESEIYSPSAAKYANISILPDGGPESVTKSPEFMEATHRWSQCMKNAGITEYGTPIEAIGDPKWRLEAMNQPRNVSALQIRIATTDMSCKEKTNLVGIGLALQRDSDNRYIASHKNVLNEFRIKLSLLITSSEK